MAYFDVEKIKVRFKIKYPRFEYIIEDIPILFDDSIDTACTDGEKLYFNRSFMESLDEEQQLFTFAHEVLHIALNHIDRCLDKDMYYWNIATDAVINDYLKSCGLKPIDKCVDIEGALNKSAEELYEQLLKEKKQDQEKPKDSDPSDKKGNGPQTDTPSSGNNQDNQDNDNEQDKPNDSDSNNNEEKDDDGDKDIDHVGHDSHEMWKKAAEKHQSEGKKNDKDVNETDEFGKNDKEKERRDDTYLTSGVDNPDSNMQGGKTPGNGRRKPDNVEEAEDTLDWKTLLIENYRSNPDWDLTYGEEEDGVIVPVFNDEETSNCEILIDTSASIDDTLIRNFLTECLSIVKTSKTKVGFFDTEFYGFHDVRNEDDINELTIEGGGGTDYKCAIEAFTENCENKIIFTDGMDFVPDSDIDAIWIVAGYYKHEIHPKNGKVIYITGEDYERMCKKHKTK